ncbi:uncharacterized, partial [Tachysurus ichikawai]
PLNQPLMSRNGISSFSIYLQDRAPVGIVEDVGPNPALSA